MIDAPIRTDLAQVGALADMTGTPAFRWDPAVGEFVHLGGPDIPDINRQRAHVAFRAEAEEKRWRIAA